MDRYYREALALSEQFQACRGVTTRPAVPVSNLFHVHFDAPKDKVEPLLIALCEETGIGVTGSLRDFDGETSYFELSVGDGYALVPEERRNDMFRSLDGKLSGIL
ncbi:hypothetical protein D1872_296890 [compost metagenome]